MPVFLQSKDPHQNRPPVWPAFLRHSDSLESEDHHASFDDRSGCHVKNLTDLAAEVADFPRIELRSECERPDFLGELHLIEAVFRLQGRHNCLVDRRFGEQHVVMQERIRRI
jgi:hypothetical protein